jgi:hypothetical protein
VQGKWEGNVEKVRSCWLCRAALKMGIFLIATKLKLCIYFNSPLLKKQWVRGRFICYELFCSCKPYFPQPLPQLLPVLPGYLYFFFFSFFPFLFLFFTSSLFFFFFLSIFYLFLPSFNIFGRPFRGREERNNK